MENSIILTEKIGDNFLKKILTYGLIRIMFDKKWISFRLDYQQLDSA